MVDDKTGLAKIREMLGELARGRSDIFVVRTWLKTVIESAVNKPRLSSFAPFQEYFVNQLPVDAQLSNMFTGEFSTPIEDTGETQLTTFRLALADHLSTPLAFATRVEGKLVLSDLYRDLFAWLADADILLAIDTAAGIVRDARLANLPFASSQPLALYLFQTLDGHLSSKASSRAFYEAVFRFALGAPEAVVADVPNILEAYIRALGDDNEVLFRLFINCPKLEMAYRGYLASHFPRLLVKRETRFMNRIKAALPHGFPAFLEALNNAQFARIRSSDLVANLDIVRPDSPKHEETWNTEGGYETAAPTTRHPTLEAPRDLNQAAAAFRQRAGGLA